jgi:hypothetical protein
VVVCESRKLQFIHVGFLDQCIRDVRRIGYIQSIESGRRIVYTQSAKKIPI